MCCIVKFLPWEGRAWQECCCWGSKHIKILAISKTTWHYWSILRCLCFSYCSSYLHWLISCASKNKHWSLSHSSRFNYSCWLFIWIVCIFILVFSFPYCCCICSFNFFFFIIIIHNVSLHEFSLIIDFHTVTYIHTVCQWNSHVFVLTDLFTTKLNYFFIYWLKWLVRNSKSNSLFSFLFSWTVSILFVIVGWCNWYLLV